MDHDTSIPSAAAVATLFRTAEERGADGASFFASGFLALSESCFRSAASSPEWTAFVAAVLEGLARCPFRDRLAEDPAFSDYRAWLDVAAPPPPDIVEGFVRVLSRKFGPPPRQVSPKVPFAVFRQSFSRRDRILQLLGASVGVARAIFGSWRHPACAFRLARDLAAAARSRLFDRDFYAWAYPNVTARRFASPLLHYCTRGWCEGRRFSPAFPALPPDTVPPRENPLLLHARLFPGSQPTANSIRRLVRELRPDLWEETVRGRLRAEAASKPPLAVVVPVYDHPELLPPLVASLLEHTPPDVLLLFVENGSSDKRVRPMLLRFAAENPGRVRVECLDENLGFAGACNHGIAAATPRDVILLNNDTVVGPRWSDSLRLAAYADDRIGTATAVSNNSGLASVPNRGRNEMPPGLSVATVARGWLHAPETAFDLHTGHGFCLYLKRAMLDEIGEFDAATFGKGYGEETDLCLRAWHRGWRHRITTRAFVWHLNAVSFGGLYKAFKVHVARHTLVARHPDLDALEAGHLPRWASFCPRLRSIAGAMRAVSPRPRILLATESSGTPPLPEPAMAALRREFEPFLLQCNGTDGTASLNDLSARTIRDCGPAGELLETGAGTDDELVSWILEYGIEAFVASTDGLVDQSLLARLAALHVPILEGIPPSDGDESPERRAARLGARLAEALSHAPTLPPAAAPFSAPAQEKTRDLVLPRETIPGAFDPAAFDRTDLSEVRSIVVDRLPLPVADDERLLLLARLCGTRLRILAKTEDPHFWRDRGVPHFRLLASANELDKPHRPPLDADFLPVFPHPAPPLPPEVLAKRIAAYRSAKAERDAPARHVVYTAIAGGYEALKFPEAPDPDIDYFYFAPAPVADEGPWTYRPFEWTDEDPTRTARWHKLHGCDLFPDAESVLWIDGNITLLSGTEREIREKLLSGPNPIATLRHFDRDNVWDEARACIARGKDDPAMLRAQVARYRAAGLPEKHPFAETTLLAFRPSSLLARAVFATWWDELSSGSRRDQISFPYAMWRNGADFTPLFDRDIRLAIDKVRFGIHTKSGSPPPQPHARQFVLSRRRFDRGGFRHLELPDGFVLSFHPDLRVRATPDHRTVLLGLAWSCDPAVTDPFAAAAACQTEDALERLLDNWSGRWILLRNGCLRMDASGLLGVFFRDGDCSSSPALLAEHSGLIIASASDSSGGMDCPPGQHQPLSDVFRLSPGQGLDLVARATFDRSPEPGTPAFDSEDARIASLLSAFDTLLHRIAADYPDRIRLSLDAGSDSRMLAALLEHAGVSYDAFTMGNERLTPCDRDIPPRLAALVGRRHRFLPRLGAPDPVRVRACEEHCAGLPAGAERDFYALRQYPEPLEPSCRVAVLRGCHRSPADEQAFDLVPGMDSIMPFNGSRILSILRSFPREDRIENLHKAAIVRAACPVLMDIPFAGDAAFAPGSPDPARSVDAATLRHVSAPMRNASPPARSVQRIPGRFTGPFAPTPPGITPAFSHSGKIGDAVFSLPFCRAVAAAAGCDQFDFHLKTGTIVERTRADGSLVRTQLFGAATAALLKPLLERQPYVRSVTVSGDIPPGAMDLDRFRTQTCLPMWGNSIPNYYMPLAPWLAEAPDLAAPWLSGGRKLDLGRKKIALFLTDRYPRETLSLSFLEPYRDEILFLGTAEEHLAFVSTAFPVDFRKTSDLSDVLDVLSSVRLAIGNQTGLFAIAEGLKIPRLLIVSDASPNVVPCGGAFQLLHETESAKMTFAAFHERFCR